MLYDHGPTSANFYRAAVFSNSKLSQLEPVIRRKKYDGILVLWHNFLCKKCSVVKLKKYFCT
jgi:hypothetical protein